MTDGTDGRGAVSNESAAPGEQHRVALPLPVDERQAWLLTAMGAAGLVYVAYLLTHPYAAYAGGLYLEISDQIVRHGYALPERIPGYTADGVPFAYPPLMFYLGAVVIDLTGIDPLTYIRVVPGLFVLAYLVPFYGVAEALLPDRRQAGLATVLLGVTPTTLRWHLSAGGMVRAPAFLLALAGCYTGIRLFRTGERRWLLASTGLFGLLVASHPTYSVFVVLSFLLFYAAFDRSLPGLLRGAVVGVGGLLLALPWWGQVAMTHGPGIFLTASGTHGGLAGGPERLVIELTYALDDFDVEWPFYVAAYVGGAYALSTRRYFLPVWLVASSYVIGKNRFLFVAGSMLTAMVVMEALVPRIEARLPAAGVGRRRSVGVSPAAAATVGVVVLAATAGGVLYGTGTAHAAHEDSPAQPAYLDDGDLAAMDWIAANTAPSATFVVLGDPAEFLPTLADRTILVGFWGVEWESTAGYYHQFALYDRISTCPDADCITHHLRREGIAPDYVYVPTGEYTVRGRSVERSPRMADSLATADGYEIVFENDAAIVARVDPDLVGGPDPDDG